MKKTDEFVDSSDDEAIVEVNPYEGLPCIKQKEIKGDKTLEKLKKIRKDHRLLNQTPIAHQKLIKQPAIKGKKLPQNNNRSPSPFPAPLATVSLLSNTVPSKPSKQIDLDNSMVPAFRGLKYKPTSNKGTERFFSTQTKSAGTCHYSSQSFALANIKPLDYTKALFLENDNKNYASYDFRSHFSKKTLPATVYFNKLNHASTILKKLFHYANAICLPFDKWRLNFSAMRNVSALTKNRQIWSLTEVLSYIYTTNYQAFQTIFSNLPMYLEQLKDIVRKPSSIKVLPAIEALQGWIEQNILDLNILSQGIPFVSEGQIPRHALLYAFGLKQYGSVGKPLISALYQTTLKPKNKYVYLGKIFVTENPNTLFCDKDSALFIPDFDKKYGGTVITKTILGEKEIQHQGANLQGTIQKTINIKLPKFNHKEMPERYKDKYGLNTKLYIQFQRTFLFLINKNESKRLSWMYLETVLLAHLIHFHEIQLFKYCEFMAQKNNKQIYWFNRKEQVIKNPFPVANLNL